MVAHDVVAVALITAEGRFDRLQEADGQFAVNRLRAVLKVAEFDGEIKLARIEDVNGLMEFGKGMRINADGVFRRDRVGGGGGVVDVRYPAEGGNDVFRGRQLDRADSRRSGRGRAGKLHGGRSKE